MSETFDFKISIEFYSDDLSKALKAEHFKICVVACSWATFGNRYKPRVVKLPLEIVPLFKFMIIPITYCPPNIFSLRFALLPQYLSKGMTTFFWVLFVLLTWGKIHPRRFP